MLAPSEPVPPARAIRETRVDPALRATDIGSEVYHAALASFSVPMDRPPSREEAPRLCWALLATGQDGNPVYPGGIRYKAEDGDQMVRMPWRTIADGVADCKSQAVLTAWVCHNAGCDVALRFVTLPGEAHFGHVYAIVDNIPVDPLLQFGSECANVVSETVPLTLP